jgi:predicted transposase YbfD/YdcC
LILIARLAGETKPYGIADWLKFRTELLVPLFDLKYSKMPSVNTIRRTLSDTIIATQLQTVLVYFLHEEYGGQESEHVVLDGKALRGTIPKGETQGVHLLSAYLPKEEVVIGQIEVETKENEISAAPRLLANLNLKGKIVSGDAMFTQRKLSVQIPAQGGDYLWFVKSNQATLLGDIKQFFMAPRKAKGWYIDSPNYKEASSINNGHGRIEHRTIQVISDETEFVQWPNLRQVFKLERRVTHIQSNKTTIETAYGITSLEQEKASAEQLLGWARSHWGIENGLHYRRDVTLKEDATRMSCSRQAEAVAVFNNFIVALSSKLGFSNLAQALRSFDAQLNRKLAQIALKN